MKRNRFCIIVIVMIFALTGSSLLAGTGQENETKTKTSQVELKRINDNFWVHISYQDFNGKPFPSNGLVVVTDKGLLLIDTTWNDEQMENLMAQTEKKFKKKFVLAIITHGHHDRFGGINTLHKKGIEVRSTPSISIAIDKAGFKPPRPYYNPLGGKENVGTTKVEILFPGEGHTYDNITVWFPQYHILFGGCLVKAENFKNLGNTEDASLRRWPDAINTLLKKYPSANTVIPGHGQ